jgi:hypothetical protein
MVEKKDDTDMGKIALGISLAISILIIIILLVLLYLFVISKNRIGETGVEPVSEPEPVQKPVQTTLPDLAPGQAAVHEKIEGQNIMQQETLPQPAVMQQQEPPVLDNGTTPVGPEQGPVTDNVQ